jgi:TolC family type I secretion outer membrane protein
MAAVALCAIVLIAGGRTAAQTLEEALVQAYLNNPTLRAERARLRATDEQVPQALSGWRPTVRLTGSAGENITDSRQGAFGGAAKRTIETAPTRFQFEVRQPVFRGLRTVSGTREAERLVRAGRAQLDDVEQSVLLQAATAYMDVVRDQAVVELNINNERVLTRQLEATRDRFEVGEVTRTDVSQAESRLAGATGTRVAAEGDLASSRAVYQNVIGALPGRLVKPVVTLALPASLEESTGVAQRENPSVVAARFNAEAASQRIDVVRGELLPELNLVGAVDRRKEVGTSGQMSESVSVIAELAVPIYQSGSVQSRVRAAKQVFGQRRVEVEQARRQAVEDAIQAWENLETARAQIRAFQAQVEATTIALEGVEQEATVGARTVLDILDAEQERLDAQVSLVRAERDEIVARFQVLQAVGRLSAEELQLPVPYYDDTRHYRDVRGKWFGLGSGEVDAGGPSAGAAAAGN